MDDNQGDFLPEGLVKVTENESFRFEIFEEPGAFSKLKAGWEELCDGLRDEITVFGSHFWYQNWWRFYGSGIGEKPYLFTMWAGEKLAGIAPLMWKKCSIHGLPVRKIGFMQNNQSLHNDFIVMPKVRVEFFKNLIRFLLKESNRWDVLFFRNIPANSSNYTALTEALNAEGRRWKQSWNGIDSPYLIPSGNWTSYLAGRSTRTRKNLRNIENRIRGAGRVVIKNIRTREEFLSCKEDLFEVARQSWAEKIGDSLGSMANQDFFESLALRAAAKGWLSVWALYLDDKMIALEFHLQAYGREHAMRGHYHSDFAALSPGTFLETAILEHVFDSPEVVQIYDFCGSFEGYKKKWTRSYVPHCDVHVYNKNLYSKLAVFFETRLAPRIKLAIHYMKMLPQPQSLARKL